MQSTPRFRYERRTSAAVVILDLVASFHRFTNAWYEESQSCAEETIHMSMRLKFLKSLESTRGVVRRYWRRRYCLGNTKSCRAGMENTKEHGTNQPYSNIRRVFNASLFAGYHLTGVVILRCNTV